PPPAELLPRWIEKPLLPVQKLSHRLLTQLRKTAATPHSWDKLCIAHTAMPQFVFELNDDMVRLRLLAQSEQDRSTWQWNGHEWLRTRTSGAAKPSDKPEL